MDKPVMEINEPHLKILVFRLKENRILGVVDEDSHIPRMYINLEGTITEISEFKKVNDKTVFHGKFDLILKRNPFHGYLITKESIKKDGATRITNYILFEYAIQRKSSKNPELNLNDLRWKNQNDSKNKD